MKKLKKKQAREIKRFTEYMISGGAYFCTGYLLFFVIDKLLHGSFFWAKSVSTLGGWTVNYILQRYWVFDNPKLAKHQTEVTGRYAIITLTDFVLDYFIVLGLKEAGVTPYIGMFLSAAFFTVWNYFWYRYYVFPEKFDSKKTVKAKKSVTRVFAHRAHGHSAYRIPKSRP